MKKRVKKETLLNAFARGVGHAAGTIAKATHGLTADAAAVVQTRIGKTKIGKTKTKVAKKEKARRKLAPKLRRRTVMKQKRAASAVTRQSRKRTSAA